ncbi:MAG: hypothetical protein JO250_15895 [Armatimonadetes bacterium]|nr:hypothetical protein [Armatimonadota bacterium]
MTASQSDDNVRAVTLDALLAENVAEDGGHAAFVRAVFLAGAEATRHVWDTPEEDAAWAHLQARVNSFTR